jgi:capsid protein
MISATLLGLQARSQEARSNWETALESKDRAIEQLEEALASRQRALVRTQQQTSATGACSRHKILDNEAALMQAQP